MLVGGGSRGVAVSDRVALLVWLWLWLWWAY